MLDGSAMKSVKDLFHFLTPRHLLIGTAIVSTGVVIIIIIIYGFVFAKRKRYRLKKRIINHLEEWISNIIVEESFDTINIPDKFYRMLENQVARQLTIDELIACRKNFSGSVGENIVKLYEFLGLKEDTIRKIKCAEKHHIQAKGIQELYLMDQRSYLPYIYKNTNNHNSLVRMESQTGIIHLAGFAGLRFLNVLSFPLTEWQQIKLLEQLKHAKKKDDLSDKIPKWLLSKNDTVVVFALKLADEHQQFAVRKEVAGCLDHPNQHVRSQAIKTLIRLADENTVAVLIHTFHSQEVPEQILILEALAWMADEEQSGFLYSLFDEHDNTIKLKAAIALTSTSKNGADTLEKRGSKEPEPFYRILRHVKTV